MKRNSMMPAFPDLRDSYSLDHQASGVFSMSSSFDSSFSSDSGSSWDLLESPCPTSSKRRTSYGSLDYDSLSAGSASQVTTPVGNEFYPTNPMTCMTQNILAGEDTNYFTSCSKPSLGRNLMMDMQYASVYSPYDAQAHCQTMFYDNSSSVSIAVSPNHSFVDPSQTMFQPATPLQTSRILGSSPDDFNMSTGLQYFLTPSPPRSLQSSRSFSSVESSPIKIEDIKLGASAALHRIQSEGSRVRKQSQKKAQTLFNTSIVAAGHFRCDFPNCESKHAFKRQEHLKRHKKTHYASKDLNCAYCHKKFQEDRRDNYRSHIKLHAQSRDKKGSRTKFFPEAVAEMNSWGRSKDNEDSVVVPQPNRSRTRASRV